jgi:hypothetical protein
MEVLLKGDGYKENKQDCCGNQYWLKHPRKPFLLLEIKNAH